MHFLERNEIMERLGFLFVNDGIYLSNFFFFFGGVCRMGVLSLDMGRGSVR